MITYSTMEEQQNENQKEKKNPDKWGWHGNWPRFANWFIGELKRTGGKTITVSGAVESYRRLTGEKLSRVTIHKYMCRAVEHGLVKRKPVPDLKRGKLLYVFEAL